MKNLVLTFLLFPAILHCSNQPSVNNKSKPFIQYGYVATENLYQTLQDTFILLVDSPEDSCALLDLSKSYAPIMMF